ncbi:DUF559 domain-containing protein [Escherichia coli]|uniref:hypothetical protein n=1 Tax=Escherichia coli TaxID=562 RepID=UPI0009930281|nr:hypothetical protein [Escherichia coli]AQW17631.1 hypothetical protein BE937_13935 [Escherichia coli]MBW0059760.1 hypothetical protein [Escherichia coli]HAX4093071.1 hypothetical protein [Escherichia coli]
MIATYHMKLNCKDTQLLSVNNLVSELGIDRLKAFVRYSDRYGFEEYKDFVIDGDDCYITPITFIRFVTPGKYRHYEYNENWVKPVIEACGLIDLQEVFSKYSSNTKKDGPYAYNYNLWCDNYVETSDVPGRCSVYVCKDEAEKYKKWLFINRGVSIEKLWVRLFHSNAIADPDRFFIECSNNNKSNVNKNIGAECFIVKTSCGYERYVSDVIAEKYHRWGEGKGLDNNFSYENYHSIETFVELKSTKAVIEEVKRECEAQLSDMSRRCKNMIRKRYEHAGLTMYEKIKGVELIRQYPVNVAGNKYYIDGYDPVNNVAVEIDESHHKQQVKSDAIRQERIKEALGCTFFRCAIS